MGKESSASRIGEEWQAAFGPAIPTDVTDEKCNEALLGSPNR